MEGTGKHAALKHAAMTFGIVVVAMVFTHVVVMPHLPMGKKAEPAKKA